MTTNDIKPWEPLQEHVLTLLAAGICEITFTKVNGEHRVMPCTLQPDLLPARVVTEDTQDTQVKKPNPDVLSVWCTDAQAWRSFRWDKFISIKPSK